jgi:hypothetical protein
MNHPQAPTAPQSGSITLLSTEACHSCSELLSNKMSCSVCSNVRQATCYCFVKDACLLPQNVAIKCKLVFFWRFSMAYSNACANCRLFVLLMDFLHSAGDLSVSARCSPLCVHKLFVCNFVTDICQRLVAPSVTFGCYASPQVLQYYVPTVFQASKIWVYHKIWHSLATSTLVWHTLSQLHNSLFHVSYQWLGQYHFTASVGIYRDTCSSTIYISYSSDICCHVGRTDPFPNVLEQHSDKYSVIFGLHTTHIHIQIAFTRTLK